MTFLEGPKEGPKCTRVPSGPVLVPPGPVFGSVDAAYASPCMHMHMQRMFRSTSDLHQRYDVTQSMSSTCPFMQRRCHPNSGWKASLSILER